MQEFTLRKEGRMEGKFKKYFIMYSVHFIDHYIVSDHSDNKKGNFSILLISSYIIILFILNFSQATVSFIDNKYLICFCNFDLS